MESKFTDDDGLLKKRASLQKLNVQEAETDIEAVGIEIADTEVEAVADVMTAGIGGPTIVTIGGDGIGPTTVVIADGTE